MIDYSVQYIKYRSQLSSFLLFKAGLSGVSSIGL